MKTATVWAISENCEARIASSQLGYMIRSWSITIVSSYESYEEQERQARDAFESEKCKVVEVIDKKELKDTVVGISRIRKVKRVVCKFREQECTLHKFTEALSVWCILSLILLFNYAVKDELMQGHW
jgi:hypothetical protein